MIVGLLSFSAAFVGIGLAVAALAKGGAIVFYSYVAFGLATLLFLGAIIATILLVRHFAKTKGYIRQIGLYLREGYILRRVMLDMKDPSEWTPELGEKVPQWEKNVQQWLDQNLPDHAPDFLLETITSTTSYFFYDNVIEEASSDALRLESRLANLREILREIRM